MPDCIPLEEQVLELRQTVGRMSEQLAVLMQINGITDKQQAEYEEAVKATLSGNDKPLRKWLKQYGGIKRGNTKTAHNR